jgi:hypothetical protein
LLRSINTSSPSATNSSAVHCSADELGSAKAASKTQEQERAVAQADPARWERVHHAPQLSRAERRLLVSSATFRRSELVALDVRPTASAAAISGGRQDPLRRLAMG